MSTAEWILTIFLGVPILTFGLAAFTFAWIIIVASISNLLFDRGRPTRRQRKARRESDRLFTLAEENKNV